MKFKQLLKRFILPLLSVFVFCYSTYAQTVSLKGKVTDEKGEPIVGASVKIKNTSAGSVTNGSGVFSLNYTGQGTLMVTAIGFTSQEVKLTGQVQINVALAEDNKVLNEVVVTALGIKRDKRILTYSSQEVKAESIAQSKEPNLVNALAGKVSGVQVTSSSGTPGSSARIVIRGATSFYGENGPLMVIDGVPVDNAETGNLNSGPGTNRIADIDPSIITSMNVLKGAAATALYGSKGANGVVIITTKTGALNQKPLITFSSDFSFENPLLPQIQNKYSQGTNGIYYDGVNQKTSTSWGARMDTLKINGQPAKVYNQSDLFFKTGHTYNNTVNIGGGGNNSTYLVSYSNFNQQGTVPTTKFLRNTFFAKYSAQVLKNLTTTFQLNYSNSQNDRLPEGYALESPVWTIFTAPVSYNLQPYLNADGTQRLYRFSRNNPYWVLDNIKNHSGVNRFLPTFTADYKPFSWLTITERFGADVYAEMDRYHESTQSVSNPNGRLVDQNLTYRQYNNDLLISANKQFGDFNVDVVLGNNLISTYNENTYANGVGLTVPGLYNMSSASTVNYSEGSSLQRKVGFYLQSNIEYKRFLLLSLTGRYDGNSVLSIDHSFYPYGSAAGSFIFSEFFSPEFSKVMNLGKVRVSYGTVGNDGSIGAYSLLTPYNKATIRNLAFPYNQQAGFLISDVLGNPNLKNERINEFEAGFEAGFFNNRISLEASFYNKKTNGGIIPTVALPPSTGYSATSVNSAVMRNKGIEVLLNVNPIKSRDFNWDFTLNFTRNRNKVLSIYKDLSLINIGFTNVVIGQPYGVIYGTRYARNAAGKLLIDDSGLPYADDNQGIVGNINPNWLGGINNNFRYKQFNFSFFFDIKRGGDIQNNVDGYGYFYGTPKVTENRGLRVVDGVNATTGQPNTVAVNGQAYYQRANGVLESVIQDGSYVKLRNVSLGYTLKPSWLSKSPFKSATFSVTGRNLWIHAPHFTGGDPEVSSFGSSNGSQGIYSFSTPTSKSVDFSLKVTL
ncbi:SusC/RagA family TonB-linked outer membrane protein [Mucilaginibacter rubeus]|uniref:SusC/RagA family TonB-linked outer membrane protein n=1 Tax=Mucilaginibacter rubeus TaxID=2027860 RepID=A0AAE6MJ35_9SPHI|nr:MULTISPECIES: SusC/RagA family TonB-linked outer membrane protein [Mucilaginibacter]QEM05238.1 SusC/RagA family TonB-linked outer membrane protein [Mucilaginibacter rubeus]QEM17830.1 SusC/RagA family TonB-linked outer membrane protein [Mucilaginibacter gossypii]QTE45640.1 SusC/RagA family TonB-linked outer membrane protein [Mucilaginibacter rubeus]QTE52237.1 SusC/RagA family TonB-linked outer membrane protein [Mucilaginibacter rubeus]QTE57325.1 SusC/RagA family TonB-linked outer membrane pr